MRRNTCERIKETTQFLSLDDMSCRKGQRNMQHKSRFSQNIKSINISDQLYEIRHKIHRNDELQ
jgi:hypothetical protein